MTNWLNLRLRIVAERGWQCEICSAPGTELHHAIFRRRRGMPELDVAENLMLVCRRCHASGKLNAEAGERFLQRQRERGYDMDRWLESLPLKIKRR